MGSMSFQCARRRAVQDSARAHLGAHVALVLRLERSDSAPFRVVLHCRSICFRVGCEVAMLDFFYEPTRLLLARRAVNAMAPPGTGSGGRKLGFPPASLVAKVVDILLGHSFQVGFPTAPVQLPPAAACVSSISTFRSVLLVREFRQQLWFRSLQCRSGKRLLWQFPICGVFFLPYHDYRILDPQFLVNEDSVLERSLRSGIPINLGSTAGPRRSGNEDACTRAWLPHYRCIPLRG